MKIYFTVAITGNFGSKDDSFKIMNYLKKYGEIVDENAGWNGKDYSLDPKAVHNRDFKWLEEADVLVAEVSNKSLGVGYEIGRAVELNKKILCLYRPEEGKRISPIISGCDRLIFKQYNNLDEAFSLIDDFFKSIS